MLLTGSKKRNCWTGVQVVDLTLLPAIAIAIAIASMFLTARVCN